MTLPKKVYIDDFGSGFSHGWHTEHCYESDIEYIHKDVFIEKACEWLKENKDHPFIGCEDCCLSGFLTDEFVEEFRKAMKGE